MALVTLADLNGKHYLGLQEGETLRRGLMNVYPFSENIPSAHNPLELVNFTQDEANFFIRLNVRHLLTFSVNNVKTFTLEQAAVIAYHRLLAVRNGLVSPRFNPENAFVDYTEAEVFEDDTIDALETVDDAAIRAVLTDVVQSDISKTFYDRVSMVAFVFRARGHHYTPDYEELYARIWKKCRYNVNLLHISFSVLATVALHAIFPVILDDFWKHGVEEARVNGALAKRFDVAPAGAAGPYVLKQGVLDLVMIAPGVRGRLRDADQYLEQVLSDLRVHRFAGSVNARYYGAKKVKFEEARLGSIAATIKAALDNLTEDAPLGKSPALTRIANNAPITGAVLGRAIGNIPNRPEVVNTLMIEEV